MHMVICVIMKTSFESCEDISANKVKYICNCLHEGASHTEIGTQLILCNQDGSFDID